MNTEKDKPTTDTQAVIEQLQSDIEALKTQLFFLTDTKIEHTNAQLQYTQTKLEEKIEKSQFDMSQEVQATKEDLKITKTTLHETQCLLQDTRNELNVANRKLKNTQNYIDETLIGSVAAFAMTTPPEGWLECNGQAVSRTEYARLFNKIGITFGVGNDETTFNLPDLRGVFVRGWEKFEGGHDSGREFGSYQDDQIQSHSHQDSGHSHGSSVGSSGNHKHDVHINDSGFHNHIAQNMVHVSDSYRARNLGVFGSGFTSTGIIWGRRDYLLKHDGEHSHRANLNSAGSHSHFVSINNGQANLSNPTNARHGDETNPKNVALLFCIKY